MPYGAPRFIGARRASASDAGNGEDEREARGRPVDRAIASFADSLGSSVSPDRVAEAKEGLQSARSRRESFESRALLLSGGIGLTTVFSVGGATFLPSLTTSMIGRIALVLFVLGILGFAVSAGYGLAVRLWTFQSISADNPTRLILRTRLNEAAANQARMAALLAAQRRTSIVADWKLARLKIAVVVYVASLGCVVVASLALIASRV
jgi:hypothetical protein